MRPSAHCDARRPGSPFDRSCRVARVHAEGFTHLVGPTTRDRSFRPLWGRVTGSTEGAPTGPGCRQHPCWPRAVDGSGRLRSGATHRVRAAGAAPPGGTPAAAQRGSCRYLGCMGRVVAAGSVDSTARATWSWTLGPHPSPRDFTARSLNEAPRRALAFRHPSSAKRMDAQVARTRGEGFFLVQRLSPGVGEVSP
jgi:hypothetical protein